MIHTQEDFNTDDARKYVCVEIYMALIAPECSHARMLLGRLDKDGFFYLVLISSP